MHTVYAPIAIEAVHPFPDIASHVVQPKFVWRIRHDVCHTSLIKMGELTITLITKLPTARPKFVTVFSSRSYFPYLLKNRIEVKRFQTPHHTAQIGQSDGTLQCTFKGGDRHIINVCLCPPHEGMLQLFFEPLLTKKKTARKSPVKRAIPQPP